MKRGVCASHSCLERAAAVWLIHPPRLGYHTGVPKPAVLWLKNSAELLGSLPGSSVLDEGSLVIGSVLPSDSGDYTCLATNEAGSVQRRTKLVVYGKRGPRGWSRSRCWEGARVQQIGLHTQSWYALSVASKGNPPRGS